MLLSPDELKSNLERLRDSIRSGRCCDSIETHGLESRQAAKVMPMSHTTSEVGFLGAIKAGALLSSEVLGKSPRRADVVLGGTNEICFYLGSAAFPDNEFGFLFSNTLTEALRGRASATPFDSGGCIRRYSLPAGTDGLAHVQAHSMPVPECRDYLGDLLTSHFEDPSAYLTGYQFTCPTCKAPLTDPHGMPDYEDGLVRMHEVRIPERVDLSYPMLLAIFAPQGNVPPVLARLVTSGVELVTYDNVDENRYGALRKASVDYILSNVLN